MQAISGQKPGTAAERFRTSASAVDVSQAEGGKSGGVEGWRIHERWPDSTNLERQQSTTMTRRGHNAWQEEESPAFCPDRDRGH